MADVTVTRNRTYRDLNLTMGRNPVTNDVLALTGADAVRRAVKTLLLTNAGEVPFYPHFGTKLYRLLFEPMDAMTTMLLDAEIRAVIATYEPRANILTLVITPDEDHNRYSLDFTFQVVNLPQPVSLSLFLTRLR